MPAFDPAKLPTGDDGSSDGTTAINAHPYAARVANSVESLTVRAQAAHSGAMVNITSGSDSSVSDGAVDLVVDDGDANTGENVITIAVTAEDRGGPKFYQVTVTRASSAASDNATLSTLSVTPAVGGTAGTAVALSDLDEKFAHMVDLTNAQDSIEVDPETTATGAVVTVKKGSKVITAAGNGNYNVAIDEGDNTITVDVLAPNFVATKTYTLTINRASANASDDDTLSSLSLSHGMLMPAFDPAKLPTGDDGSSDGTTAINAHPYAERVANSVGSLTVMAQAAHSGAMVNITSGSDSSVSDGAVDLVVDDNVITIAVTAEDRGGPKFYQVTVTRAPASASSNAALSGLTLETEIADDVHPSLTPAFETDSLPALTDGAHHFTASVSRGTGEILVVPVAGTDTVINVTSNANDAVSMVEVANREVYEVDLEVGDNVITVIVTAPDVVTTKTYKITINRPGISNAALSDLSLSGVSLNEAFGTAADDAYTADVASSVESTTVMATAVQSNATVSILPGDADSAMDGHQVALTAGPNTITVTVTAGSNTRVYTVTVTVAPPVEGDLLDMYDADDDNQISKDEAIAAINDYLFGEGDQQITKAEVIEVINLYLFG